ncbi:unnamed protein product [Arctogadus glacialis]
MTRGGEVLSISPSSAASFLECNTERCCTAQRLSRYLLQPLLHSSKHLPRHLQRLSLHLGLPRLRFQQPFSRGLGQPPPSTPIALLASWHGLTWPRKATLPRAAGQPQTGAMGPQASVYLRGPPEAMRELRP